jgi:hypothetical protein
MFSTHDYIAACLRRRVVFFGRLPRPDLVERLAHLLCFFLDKTLEVVTHLHVKLGIDVVVLLPSLYPSEVNDWPVSGLWNQIQGRTIRQAIDAKIVV